MTDNTTNNSDSVQNDNNNLDSLRNEPIKEQSLWQAIIVQATIDATCAPINAKTRRIKTQAIIWLSIQNPDFLFVCEMAGMDPMYIIKGAKKVIKQSTKNHRKKLHRKRILLAKQKKQESTPEYIYQNLLQDND